MKKLPRYRMKMHEINAVPNHVNACLDSDVALLEMENEALTRSRDFAEIQAGIVGADVLGDASIIVKNSKWQAGEPEHRGVYIIRDETKFVCLARKTIGPKGGYRPLREISGKHPTIRWCDEWEWLKIS